MEIVKRYYEGDPSLFFAYAHPKAVILSVGKGQVIEGKDAIVKSFTIRRKSLIRYEVMSMVCKQYPLTRDCRSVLLQMDIIAYFPDGRVTNVNQRLTASWKNFKGKETEKVGMSEGWLFFNVHLSVAMEMKASPTIITHLSEQLLYETTGMYQHENKNVFRDVTGLTHYLSVSKIIRIQGERQYAHIFLAEGGCIRIHKQMRELETELGQPFIRIHNSHLVNANYIKRFWNYKVILLDGTMLPVSRSCFAETKKAFDLQKKGIE